MIDFLDGDFVYINSGGAWTWDLDGLKEVINFGIAFDDLEMTDRAKVMYRLLD